MNLSIRLEHCSVGALLGNASNATDVGLFMFRTLMHAFTCKTSCQNYIACLIFSSTATVRNKKRVLFDMALDVSFSNEKSMMPFCLSIYHVSFAANLMTMNERSSQ